MSFNNFGDNGAQPSATPQEQGGFGAPGADQQPNSMGQQMDPAQPQGQFPGAPAGGPPGGPGPQASGEKTTLW